jgi:hypothetical protein
MQFISQFNKLTNAHDEKIKDPVFASRKRPLKKWRHCSRSVFALWVFVHFGQFFLNYRNCPHFGATFLPVWSCINWTKMGWATLWAIFYKLIWSPWMYIHEALAELIYSHWRFPSCCCRQGRKLRSLGSWRKGCPESCQHRPPRTLQKGQKFGLVRKEVHSFVDVQVEDCQKVDNQIVDTKCT